jgi:uncharacterized protein (TIGR02599 family)
MKSRQSGSTLAEMLMAVALLGMVLTFTAGFLNSGKKSYVLAKDSAAQATARDNALSSLRRALDTICFTPRPCFSADGSHLEVESDQHFVCGPARSLLPDVRGLCGDGIFFQRQNHEGTTEATGFFVQYEDDAPWRPPLLPRLKPQLRFRLLQFQQTSAELTLYRTTGSATRAALNQWFAPPAGRLTAHNYHVVAENIIAMLIDSDPVLDGTWDTRRYQWDSRSSPAQLMKHSLPRSLTISLLVGAAGHWQAFEEAGSGTLVHDLRILANQDHSSPGRTSRQILQQMRDLLRSNSISCEMVEICLFLNN